MLEHIALFYIDEIAYLHQLPSSRAGMAFV